VNNVSQKTAIKIFKKVTSQSENKTYKKKIGI